jgi:hypothetical protein
VSGMYVQYGFTLMCFRKEGLCSSRGNFNRPIIVATNISQVAHDDRCKILISSLQDTLHGVETKSYSSGERSRRSRSRERDARAHHRAPRRRERSASRYRDRSRDREDRDRYVTRGCDMQT